MDGSIKEAISKLIDKFDSAFLLTFFIPFCAMLGCISCFLLKTSPKWLVRIIGELAFSPAEQRSLSISLLICSLALLLYVPFSILYWLKQRKPKQKNGPKPIELIVNDMVNLSDEEKLLLALCLLSNRQTFTAAVAAPIVQHLMARGMVIYGGSQGYQTNFPFMIPGSVWKYLKNHTEVLDCQMVQDLRTASETEISRAWARVTRDGFSVERFF